MQSPSTSGDDGSGRDARGRFIPGNKLSRGNPHARRVARLRAALLRAVSPQDLEAVIRALLESAKAGDVAATRELLQRLLGPPEALDVIQRLEALEAALGVEAREGR